MCWTYTDLSTWTKTNTRIQYSTINENVYFLPFKANVALEEVYNQFLSKKMNRKHYCIGPTKLGKTFWVLHAALMRKRNTVSEVS